MFIWLSIDAHAADGGQDENHQSGNWIIALQIAIG